MVVAQKIVEEISHNQYQAGTKLATEREMLLQHEVGRGTLREALRFLEMNGVITMKPGPGGGPIVGEPDSHDLAGTLGLFLELRETRFSAIVEVRKVLEPAIAQQAAERSSAELLAELERSVTTMEDNLEDEGLFLIENENFHEVVAWASGNPVFSLLISSLHWITDGTPLGVDYPLQRRRAVAAAHRRIYQAIAAGKPKAAGDAMANHVAEFQRYLQSRYPSVYESAVHWGDVAP